ATGTLQNAGCINAGGTEFAMGVAADASSNVHIVGATASGNNSFLTVLGGTVVANAFQASNLSTTGSPNAFYISVKGDLTAANGGSLIGGYGTDIANAVAVDSNGRAYITGTTSSLGNPNLNAGNCGTFAGTFFPVSAGAATSGCGGTFSASNNGAPAV